MGRHPALDGIRGIAVTAVVLYHLGVPWAQGGFLGVEVFFALSGYLITARLVPDLRTHGRIRRGRFWRHRARRLLPALFTLLAVLGTIWALAAPDELARWRGQMLAALTYSSNWVLLARGDDYFAQLGPPNPFEHLWSLAVEEQFYLVWPMLLAVLAAVGGLTGRVRRRMTTAVPTTVVFLVLVALAVGAYAWMGAVAQDSPNRAYLSTFTRAGPLLAGAALGLVWRPWERVGRRSTRRREVRGSSRSVALPAADLPHRRRDLHPAQRTAADLTVAGAAGLIVWLTWQVRADTAWLYPWGFVAAAGATLAAVAFGVVGAPTLVGNRLAVWAGTRSYGLYLWHWPIFVFTRPGVDVPWEGPGVDAVRVAAACAAAELSFRLVERPFLDGSMLRWFPRGRRRVRRGAPVVLASVVAAVALIVAAMVAPSPPGEDEIADMLRAAEEDLAAATGGSGTLAPLPSSTTTSTAAPAATPTFPSAPPPVPGQPSLQAVARAPLADGSVLTAPPPPPPPPPVALVGDSVMLGANQALLAELPGRGYEVPALDARVSRPFREGAGIVGSWLDAGFLGTVVIHLGNNGPIDPGALDVLLDRLGDERAVALVTVRLPRAWEAEVNDTIRRVASERANVIVVDWNGHSQGQGGWFYSDGIHLRPDGAAAYARLIADALEPTRPKPAPATVEGPESVDADRSRPSS